MVSAGPVIANRHYANRPTESGIYISRQFDEAESD